MSNGIPELPLAPREPAAGPLRIVYLGTLRESKGVLSLIRAVGVLRERGVPVGLELVGLPVDAAFAAAMTALIDSLGVRSAVETPGHLEGAAKQAALARSEVFAFPSGYTGEKSERGPYGGDARRPGCRCR